MQKWYVGWAGLISIVGMFTAVALLIELSRLITGK